MNKDEIKTLIKDLVQKTTVSLEEVSISEEKGGNMWVSLTVGEPHLFTLREGEGLQALNHLVHRILESKAPKDTSHAPSILIDINGFQKKKVDNIKAVAHMMAERARYFKSNIEVDPMPAFERRIVHEFLADEADLKTESVGVGSTRRVVIIYTGSN